MSHKLAIGCALSIVGVVAFLALFIRDSELSCLFGWSTYQVARIHCDEETHLLLWADCFFESIDGCRQQSILYEIKQNGQQLTQPTSFGVARMDPKSIAFEVLKADGGTVWALVEGEHHHVVLVLYNTKDGCTWPYQREDESWRDRERRGAKLLEILRRELNDKGFVLSSELKPSEAGPIVF